MYKKVLEWLYTKPAIIIGLVLSCLLITAFIPVLVINIEKKQPLAIACAIFTIGMSIFGVITQIIRAKKIKWTNHK